MSRGRMITGAQKDNKSGYQKRLRGKKPRQTIKNPLLLSHEQLLYICRKSQCILQVNAINRLIKIVI